ncbi:MAG: hypothetical protein NTX73_14040 [Rhodobacterales bacterium]|nr:hypothetical protein [Rhodobacterales bacterium]
MYRFDRFVPAAAVILAIATPALADSYGIRFRNQTNNVLQYLYASDTNNDNWENDLLGQNVLQPGQYLDVTIHNVSNCMYDVLFQFDNGAELQDQVNVCTVGTYTINP